VEVSALNRSHLSGIGARTPLLRLQSDERLVAMTRRGNDHAFEALVARYQSRLLAFCRHMLGSREDAEDVLQEVFAAAYGALLGDNRDINVRPWLYRIARNRSLNHLRRTQPIAVDSLDHHFAENGQTTADKVHEREEFRQLVADVQQLPETQRTALLLREIDALSYEQIAEAMETTVPSVKSLLVRARVGLAEMAESRRLTCEEVRFELGEVAEGLKRMSPPVRRHVKACERCGQFRDELRRTNKALAAMLPIGPLLLLKKLLLAGGHAGASAGASAGAGAAASAGAGSAAGGLLSAGIGTVTSKAAAGLAAAALVTATAAEVKHVQQREPTRAAVAAQVVAPPAAKPAVKPVVVAQVAEPAVKPVKAVAEEPKPLAAEPKAENAAAAGDQYATDPATQPSTPTATTDEPATTTPSDQPTGTTQEDTATTTLPADAAPSSPESGSGTATTPASSEPAPAAAEPQPTTDGTSTTTPSSEPAPTPTAEPAPTP
jgi:RNA polymerase sigma factor (sigma-70 family)